MSAIHYLLQMAWVEPVGWTLIHFLWQGVLIWIAGKTLLHIWHDKSANVRYLTACGLMFACVLAVACTFIVIAKPFSGAPPVPARPPLTNFQAPETSQITQPMAASTPSVDAGAEPASTPSNTAQNSSAAVGAQNDSVTSEVEASRQMEADAPSWLSYAFDLVARWSVPFWMAGVSMFALRLFLSWCRLHYWQLRAQPVTDALPVQSLARLMDKMGITKRVALKLSSHISSPLTLGWLKPAIMIPAQALTGLTAAQLEAILAHELAHIKRYDYLVNLLQSTVEVVLFYHPAIWWISNEMRKHREECCDEMAAAACSGRMEVAKALLSLAEMRKPPQPALAAKGGNLLQRVSRLLGRSTPEPLFQGRNAAWSLALLSVLMVSIGIIYSSRLIAAEVEEIASTKPAPTGVVLDETNSPVANAKVHLYRYVTEWGLGNEVIEEVQSDNKGQFTLSRKLEFKIPNGTSDTDHYVLIASIPNKAPGWVTITGLEKAREKYTLKLTPPVSQQYEVVDQKGAPIKEARLWLSYSAIPKGVEAYYNGSLSIPHDLGVCSAVTDESGKAVLTNAPDTSRTIRVSAPGFETAFSGKKQQDGRIRYTLYPAATLEGRVLDPLGRPVENATVSLDADFKWHQFFLGKTDRDGYYKITGIWSNGSSEDWGRYKVTIKHPLFTTAETKIKFTSGQHIKDYNIDVAPGTEILGQILDPATKTPLAGANVLLDSPSGRISVFSNNHGQFKTRVIPGEVYPIFASSPGGTYVNDSGGSQTTRAFGNTFPLTIYSPKAVGKLGIIRGKTVAADQSPVSNCKVVKVSPTFFIRTQNADHYNSRSNVSNNAGEFELRNIPTNLELTLLAITEDGNQAGILPWQSTQVESTLDAPIVLTETKSTKVQIVDIERKPQKKTEVNLSILISNQSINTKKQTTDDNGMLNINNAIPGLKYELSFTNARDEARLVFDPLAPSPDGAPLKVTLDKSFIFQLIHPELGVMPIKSFKEYFVWILSDGERVRWSNGRLKILKQTDAGATVASKQLILSKPGDKIDMLIETTDGVLVDSEGFIPEQAGLIKLTPKTITKRDTVDDPSIGNVATDEIVGRIVDPQGKPIEGASVTINGHYLWREKPPLITGKDGIFKMPAEKDRYYTWVTAFKEGYAPVFLTDIPVGQGFKVRFQNNTRLKGKFDVSPPSKVIVKLEKNKRSTREQTGFTVRNILFCFETDEEGNYDLFLEPGIYNFKAKSTSNQFSSGEITVRENQTTAFPTSLEKGHNVTIELIDWNSREPIPGANAHILFRREDSVMAIQNNSTRTSDDSGLLEWKELMPGNTNFVCSNMGSYHSQSSSFPYSRWWREDEPVEWRRVDPKQGPLQTRTGTDWLSIDITRDMPRIRVYMEKGIKVSGVITDSENLPLEGAQVSPVTRDGQSLTGDSRFTMITDKEGKFSGYIPAGNGVIYNLCASYWPERPAPAANSVSELFDSKPGDEFTFNLKMPKGSWVTGRVLDAQGKPVGGQKITAIAKDKLDGPFALRIAKTDAEGRYRIGPLRRAEYDLHLGEGGGAPIRVHSQTPDLKITTNNNTDLTVGDIIIKEKTAPAADQ